MNQNNQYQIDFNKQKAYFNSKVTYSYEFRINMLKRLKAMIIKYENEISLALWKDLGKSYLESYMCEIGFLLSNINFTIANLKKWMKTKKVKTEITNFLSSSYIIKEPFGNVLIISPWNYPVLLALDPLIGSICAGNTTTIKLSEVSNNVSRCLTNIIKETFDPAYINVYQGGVSETTEILKLPFNFIFFTGSEKVGKIIMQAAALNLTPVCLELGGKSPCIITNDADLEIAAQRIAFGKFLNAGQTCVAPDYIYIDETVKQEFVTKLIDKIKLQYQHNALNNDDYPKIINEQHLERLLRLIDKDKVVYGGNNNRLKLEPTILDNVTFDDLVMKEEIFGPILPIITYKKIDEVIDKLTKLPHPLALYLFSSNKKIIKIITTQIRFGGGCVNDTMMHLVSHHLPFGGIGNSGMGSYHGKASFDIFSHSKSLLNKSTKIDIKLRYQPYNHKKEKIIRKIFK